MSIEIAASERAGFGGAFIATSLMVYKIGT
jgi:hypothetical protein